MSPRVLYASIQIPSPCASNGGGQACFQYLEALARLADVHVVTLAPRARESWLEPLRAVAAGTTVVPWSPSVPVQLGRYAAHVARGPRRGALRPVVNRPFLDAVHAALARGGYDLVQVDWTEVARQVRVAGGTPFVCGVHDVREKVAARQLARAHGLLRRRAARRRLARVRREEVELFERATCVLTLSESDARRVRELAPRARARAAVYKRADAGAEPPAWSAREPATLLYVGDFGRRVNRDAVERLVREVLPVLRARDSRVRLRLAGGRASGAFRRRMEHAGVEVDGYASSLASAYRTATVLAAPIDVGGGLHIKLVEAMSHGLPVVTTPVGNDGLAAPPGEAVRIGRTAAELAEACAELVAHPARADALGRAGRAHVLRTVSEERAVEAIRRTLADAGLGGAGDVLEPASPRERAARGADSAANRPARPGVRW